KNLEEIMQELKQETDKQGLDTMAQLNAYVPSEKIQTKLTRCLNDAVVFACREVLESDCKNVRKDILTVLYSHGLNKGAEYETNFDDKVKSQIVSGYFNMYLISSVVNNFFPTHGIDLKSPIERQKYEGVIQRGAQ